MSNGIEYVRARIERPGSHAVSRTTSKIRAKAMGWEVLKDEPTHLKDGRIRPDTRLDGRPLLPTVSAADKATEKAAKSAKKSDNKPSTKE